MSGRVSGYGRSAPNGARPWPLALCSGSTSTSSPAWPHNGRGAGGRRATCPRARRPRTATTRQTYATAPSRRSLNRPRSRTRQRSGVALTATCTTAIAVAALVRQAARTAIGRARGWIRSRAATTAPSSLRGAGAARGSGRSPAASSVQCLTLIVGIRDGRAGGPRGWRGAGGRGPSRRLDAAAGAVGRPRTRPWEVSAANSAFASVPTALVLLVPRSSGQSAPVHGYG